jgi:hypothetical protein
MMTVKSRWGMDRDVTMSTVTPRKVLDKCLQCLHPVNPSSKAVTERCITGGSVRHVPGAQQITTGGTERPIRDPHMSLSIGVLSLTESPS